MRASERQAELKSLAEQSYEKLDGEWHDWLEVAKKYEHKVPYQDRLDIRHDIMLELYRARQRDNKPLPLLRAYRIASLMVALYWRDRIKREVKVCVYNGVASEPHCKTCNHKPPSSQCPYLAIRPIESLDEPTSYANDILLRDTVADDSAIDLDAWLDDKAFQLGCPMRLIEVATKRANGIPLNKKDQKYLERTTRKERARYQTTLF